MKKYILILSLSLISVLGFSQASTSALQRSILAAIQSNSAIGVSSSTITAMKKGIDTLNQSERRIMLLLKYLEGKADSLRTAIATNSVIGISTNSANVGGFTAMSSTTITMSVAGAYATGDYMGTTTTPQTFTNVCRISGGSGVIKGIVMSDKIVTANVDMELWLFNATFTAPTDNAAWAISDAESTTRVAVIRLSTLNWFATANNQVYSDDAISMAFDLPTGTSFYYALVARGTTPALTSLDIEMSLIILQD